MMIWISLIRYLAYSDEWSYIPRTIAEIGPTILKVAFECLPIYVGVAFFGMSAFNVSETFANFSISFYTLFSITQNYSMTETYREITPYSSFVGTIFVVSVMFFTIR
jgi:hypothetical protein